jgi:hypothetical protein
MTSDYDAIVSGPGAYSVRRRVLHTILVEAAVDAGAEPGEWRDLTDRFAGLYAETSDLSSSAAPCSMSLRSRSVLR